MEGKENNGPQQVSLTVNSLPYSGELTRDENGEWSGELRNPKLNFIIKVEKGVLKDGALLWGKIDNGLITYTGAIEGGKRSGEGELRVRDGTGTGAYTVIMTGKFNDSTFLEGTRETHYNDGSIRSEEWRDKKPSGQERWDHPDGYYEEGEFKDGSFSGNGKVRIRNPDGSVYDGAYRDGKPHGQGLKKGPGEDYEDGEFVDGSFSGSGKVRITDLLDGSVYEGEYSNKLRHGYGKVTHKNGCSMEGMFGYGLAKDIVLERKLPNDRLEFSHIIFDWNGNVLLKEKLGGKPAYVDKRINFGALGELKRPPMVVPANVKQTKVLEDRKVRIDYAYDSVYTGEVDKDGKPNGKGEWTVPGEESREGTFKNGEFIEGDVVMKLDSDVTYRVEYKDGKFIGNGKLKEKNGEYRECETSKANVLLKKCSEKKPPMVVPAKAEETKTLEGRKMEIIYEDDSIYVGRVGVDGKPHGRGTWIDAEKKELRQGEFADGEFVGGEVVMELSDNISYAGGYRNGKFDGMGELKSKDGEYYKKGRFGDNILIDGSLNIIGPDGSIYKGGIRNHSCLFGENVEVFHLNGNYESGKFVGGSLCNGKIRTTCSDGSVYEGDWKNCKREGYGKLTSKNGDLSEGEFFGGQEVKTFRVLKDSDIYYYRVFDKSSGSYSYRMLAEQPVRGEQGEFKMDDDSLAKLKPFWENDGHGNIKYYFYGEGTEVEKTIVIKADEANKLLSSGKYNIEDLVTGGAMEVLDKTNKKLKDVTAADVIGLFKASAEKMIKLRAAKCAAGFKGGYDEEGQAIMFSMAKNGDLKNFRFGTRKTSYSSMTLFLESIGINQENIKSIEERYVVMMTDADPNLASHAVCFIVNLEEIKNVGWDKLNESSKCFINVYDSSRITTDKLQRETDRIYGNVTKNSRAINLAQQALGNCWFQAEASVLMALENPELVEKLLAREIQTYALNEHKWLRPNDVPNEFMLRQIQKLQEIMSTLGVSTVQSELLVENFTLGDIKSRIAELARGETLLGELDKRIKEAFEIFEGKLKNLEGEVPGLGDEEYRKYKKDTADEYRKKLEEKIKDISAKVGNKQPGEKAGLIENLKTFVAAGEEMNRQADDLKGRLDVALDTFREVREKAKGAEKEVVKSPEGEEKSSLVAPLGGFSNSEGTKKETARSPEKGSTTVDVPKNLTKASEEIQSTASQPLSNLMTILKGTKVSPTGFSTLLISSPPSLPKNSKEPATGMQRS